MSEAPSRLATFRAAKTRILAEFAEMTATSLARVNASWVALEATAGMVDREKPAWPQESAWRRRRAADEASPPSA
jgi:hypothetical protein